MKCIISNDLIKKVISVKTITKVVIWEDSLRVYHNGTCIENSVYDDNIHSFAHKCKTWAMLEGYQIKTWFDEITCWCTIHHNNKKIKKFEIQGPEQQAIFDACEWILEYTKGN